MYLYVSRNSNTTLKKVEFSTGEEIEDTPDTLHLNYVSSQLVWLTSVLENSGTVI